MSLVTASTLLEVASMQNHEYTLCTSPICKEAGDEIINSINKTVDPCTDFFQHACGGWIATHPVKDSDPLTSQIILIEQKVDQEVKTLLEKNDANDSEAIRKAKDFYNICINRAAVNQNRQRNLEAIVIANGNWPLTVPVDQWNPQQLPIWQQIHENLMNSTEFAGLFQITVGVQAFQPQTYVITLQSVKPPGRTFQYVFEKVLKFNRSPDVPEFQIIKDIEEMLQFEAELTKVYSAQIPDEIDALYLMVTISDLQSIWDDAVKHNFQYQIDWLNTIRQRFKDVGIPIDANEMIVIKPGVYLQLLAALLLKTPIRTIVNYIFWYAVSSGIDSIASTDTIQFQGQPITWCLCCQYHKMKHAVSLMYVRNHFTGPDALRLRESVSDIYLQLRKATEGSVDKSTWMKRNARELFKDKFDDMTNRIGYPDWYDVPGEVDKYYNELEFSSDHFENILVANRFDSRKALLKLREPTVKTEVEALRFGALGAIIGHEMFHGFDTKGVQRDKDGDFGPWLPKLSRAEHAKRATCLVNQFNQYRITENASLNKTTHVNGRQTLDENIADNAGYFISFKAYQRHKSSHPNENVKIPGLEQYSDEKLFFYGLANAFCDFVRPEFLIDNRDVHAPTTARINVGLSNIHAFSDSFECKREDKMNPIKKCTIWD